MSLANPTPPVQLDRKPHSAEMLVQKLLLGRDDLGSNRLRDGADWRQFDLSITVYSVHSTRMLVFSTPGNKPGEQPLDRYRFPVLTWTAAAGNLDDFSAQRFDLATPALQTMRHLSFDFQWSRSTNQQLLRYVAVPAILT